MYTLQDLADDFQEMGLEFKDIEINKRNREQLIAEGLRRRVEIFRKNKEKAEKELKRKSKQ